MYYTPRTPFTGAGELSSYQGNAYAPVDPFKPSVTLGVNNILGGTKDRTIDEVPVDVQPIIIYQPEQYSYERRSRSSSRSPIRVNHHYNEYDLPHTQYHQRSRSPRVRSRSWSRERRTPGHRGRHWTDRSPSTASSHSPFEYEPQPNPPPLVQPGVPGRPHSQSPSFHRVYPPSIDSARGRRASRTRLPNYMVPPIPLPTRTVSSLSSTRPHRPQRRTTHHSRRSHHARPDPSPTRVFYPGIPPGPIPYVPAPDEKYYDPGQTLGDRPDSPSSGITWLAIFLSLVLDVIPRQIYLHLLLRFPALYWSRVTRIFQDANLGMSEIKRMALEAVNSDEAMNKMLIYNGIFPQESGAPIQYVNLRNSWQSFIDSLMREWKTLNIISVLLLSAILTILQIGSAAANPLTRYSALLSLVCALMSLLYGCIYIIRFGSMRKTHKAAEWANESERTSTSIFWNVWVMLAMPAVWLAWSMIFYIACILAFVWQTGTSSDQEAPTQTAHEILIPRIVISGVFCLGFLYLIFIGITFRQYSDPMEAAWKERIRGWVAEKSAKPSYAYPQATGQPFVSQAGGWGPNYHAQTPPRHSDYRPSQRPPHTKQAHFHTSSRGVPTQDAKPFASGPPPVVLAEPTPPVIFSVPPLSVEISRSHSPVSSVNTTRPPNLLTKARRTGGRASVASDALVKGIDSPAPISLTRLSKDERRVVTFQSHSDTNKDSKSGSGDGNESAAGIGSEVVPSKSKLRRVRLSGGAKEGAGSKGDGQGVVVVQLTSLPKPERAGAVELAQEVMELPMERSSSTEKGERKVVPVPRELAIQAFPVNRWNEFVDEIRATWDGRQGISSNALTIIPQAGNTVSHPLSTTNLLEVLNRWNRIFRQSKVSVDLIAKDEPSHEVAPSRSKKSSSSGGLSIEPSRRRFSLYVFSTESPLVGIGAGPGQDVFRYRLEDHRGPAWGPSSSPVMWQEFVLVRQREGGESAAGGSSRG